jgi:acetyl esterase
MAVHPYIEQYFEEHPDERKWIQDEVPPLEQRPSIYKVEDRIIRAEEADIPIRIYTPDEKEDYPLFLFFHGGNFVEGDLDSHDVPCRMIASMSGYKVISVDYRLAPDHPAPAALRDGFAAAEWVIEYIQELGGTTRHIAIGGQSAGGALAAAVALKASRQRAFKFSKLVLHYPVADLDMAIEDSPYPSRALYNVKYGVDVLGSAPYLKKPEDAKDPFVSPVCAGLEELANMPPVLILTAEFDPLRDEGEAFAKKLKQAGASVSLIRFNATVHGFLKSFPGTEDYNRGFQLTADFLKTDK